MQFLTKVVPVLQLLFYTDVLILACVVEFGVDFSFFMSDRGNLSPTTRGCLHGIVHATTAATEAPPIC